MVVGWLVGWLSVGLSVVQECLDMQTDAIFSVYALIVAMSEVDCWSDSTWSYL